MPEARCICTLTSGGGDIWHEAASLGIFFNHTEMYMDASYEKGKRDAYANVLRMLDTDKTNINDVRDRVHGLLSYEESVAELERRYTEAGRDLRAEALANARG